MDTNELARFLNQLLNLTLDEGFCEGEGIHAADVPDEIRDLCKEAGFIVRYGDKEFQVNVVRIR